MNGEKWINIEGQMYTVNIPIPWILWLGVIKPHQLKTLKPGFWAHLVKPNTLGGVPMVFLDSLGMMNRRAENGPFNAPKGNERFVFQTSIFRCKLAVSFREGTFYNLGYNLSIYFVSGLYIHFQVRC